MTDAAKQLAAITPKIRKQLHQSGLEMFPRAKSWDRHSVR